MIRPVRRLAGTVLFTLPLTLVPAADGRAQDLPGFAIIAGQSLTNTGPTTITGNIAVSPGVSYTGSGSVTQTGSTYVAEGVSGRVQGELTTLYNVLAGRPTSAGGQLTGQDLGGLTLAPGVYSFDTSAGLSAGQTLTLDGGGDPAAVFIFNIGTTLTAGSGSAIVLQNGAQGGNVFFRIGSSATLDTSADLVGQLVALTSITLNTAATIDCGAAFARNGSITLDTNTINICTLADVAFDPEMDTVEFTEDERSVVSALADYTSGGGELPVTLGILATVQDAAEMAASIDQLSGEVGTGVAPMVLQSMNGFLDTVARSAPRAPGLVPRQVNDGVPIGMVLEKVDTAYTGKYDPGYGLAAASPAIAAASARSWGVWASAYGSGTELDGDADVGSEGLSIDNRGLAAGLTVGVGERSQVGLAVGFDTADFALSGNGGSGSADTTFVALHGRTTLDRGYVEAALGLGRSDVSTGRTLTIGGTDRLVADTTADTVAAHVEAGYHMGRFTPFIGLRAGSVRTPDYAETATLGTDSYALRYDANTTRSLKSELGVAVAWPVTPAGNGLIGLRAAWGHEFADSDASGRSFLSVPDVDFPITGAERDRDTLILAGSVTLAAANGLYVDGTVSQELSANLRDLSGTVTVGYRW